MEPYPPEYDEEPPEDGVAELFIAVAVCHGCEEVIGPTHSEDVGQELNRGHGDHDTDVLKTWTELEVLDYYFDLDREERR